MIVTVAPLAIVPRAQVKLGPTVHVPWLVVIVPWMKSVAGQVSLRDTAWASDGPALWTVIV